MTLKEKIKEEIFNAVQNGYLTKVYGEEFEDNPTVDACVLQTTETILEILKSFDGEEEK